MKTDAVTAVIEAGQSGDVAAAVAAGVALAKAEDRVLFIDAIPIAIVPEGYQVEVLERALALSDERSEHPRRRRGVSTLTELDAFLAHALLFKTSDSVVFADNAALKLTAVYDYHAHDRPAWCQHRGVYACPKSPAWVRWMARHEKALTQDQLGDILEEDLEDLVSQDGFPKPIELLEMARNLRLHTTGKFERKVDPTSGSFALVCKQETESTSTPIPRAFLLGIPVFDGGDHYRVEVRIKLKMVEGTPRFSLTMHRYTEIERDAFGVVRQVVHDKTGLPVLAGAPEQ